MSKAIIVFFCLGTLYGCFTNRGLLREYRQNMSIPKNGQFDEVSGSYADSSITAKSTSRLCMNLLSCLSFYPEGEDSIGYTKIVLIYDGLRNPDVRMYAGDTLARQFDLQVKNKKTYLSVKRNLKAVGVPPVFYIHNERKLILFTDNGGNLVTVLGTQATGIILIISGGYSYKSANVFPPLTTD